MFNKILIANRGEIACRVIKTARRLGVATVAVYSDADKSALHVSMADEAIHIGGSPSSESYLLGERVIEAAKKSGSQAIHPGYGFLSENADFCKHCADSDIVFIGPPVEAIESMGSKSAAKRIMANADVPLVPGYHGEDQDPELIRQSAEEMGYPVLLKAVAGGGGKGMRQVLNADEFDEALAAARREAKSSFGNDDMLVEKYLTQPRHVEVQVFCDQQGNGVYLFERDCSVQRRHQKVMEEAPAPDLPRGLREKMGEAALRAAQAINYIGAGTVEFLLDIDGSFYFMEMNTRLQVEHPVTEFITGQDLVEWQLRVASGEPLPLSQQELSINGHAFEARIYAEDPDNDFLPQTGRLDFIQPPQANEHVRVDTGVVQGDEVSVYYDPMIAKLIVWDESREKALSRMAKALSDYLVRGVKTNIPFLYNLATSSSFIDAALDTRFIDKHEQEIFRQTIPDENLFLPIACVYSLLRQEQEALELQNCNLQNQNDITSPWYKTNSWRMNAPNIHQCRLLLGNKVCDFPVEEIYTADIRCFHIKVGERKVVVSGRLDGSNLYIDIKGHHQRVKVAEHDGRVSLFHEKGAIDFERWQPDLGDDQSQQLREGFSAPMNGRVVDVMVVAGDSVKQDDTLLVMEAMKMELAIKAPADGAVREIYYSSGDLVEGGAELLLFTEAESE